MHQASNTPNDKASRAGSGAPAPASPLTAQAIRQLRGQKRESQEKFWSRFGVTQSSGSRFEAGVPLPGPLAILIRLYAIGKLNDKLLGA
ncbi:helix-turn-helix domain-containing protein [Massilia jejuensis]|uniref:Helix-turn-helix domain-containing protein n=1 Tax=Massilia jejuensis TaxID=648894 RepID=A0ABW0PLF3_9BURK